VNIDHKVISGCLADGLMKPRRPALRAYLYEAVLDTFYAPFFVERQNLCRDADKEEKNTGDTPAWR